MQEIGQFQRSELEGLVAPVPQCNEEFQHGRVQVHRAYGARSAAGTCSGQFFNLIAAVASEQFVAVLAQLQKNKGAEAWTRLALRIWRLRWRGVSLHHGTTMRRMSSKRSISWAEAESAAADAETDHGFCSFCGTGPELHTESCNSYVAANGSKIPNIGEKDIRFITVVCTN